jgi:hypothetical protein
VQIAFEMSVVVSAKHFFLGLSDELAVRSREQTEGNASVDISAEARIKLRPRWALSSPRDHGIDQLFHCRKHLVWSTEHRERLRLESAGPISDAELCTLVEDSAATVLCVAEPGLLTMYSTDGDLQEHASKTPVRALWATPVGMLIEGFDGMHAQLVTHMISGPQSLRAVNCARLRTGAGADPMSAAVAAPGSAAAALAHYAWERERVLFTRSDTPIAVTSDLDLCALHIWCLKAFPESELTAAATPGRQHGGAHSTPRRWRASATPGLSTSALSSQSRVRTPEGHTQPHVFHAYRSGDIGTASTWMHDPVRAVN